MRIVESFPFPVREIEHVWIPLTDGARLSARLWLPQGTGPVPAVLEYIPYRKRDDTRWRDEPMHGYFAGHGYAAVRIDVRGSGTSDGVLEDEYSEAEWSDGLEALRWIARQPWCDGRVGIIGKSWGGINALQIAALRPPELAGIITACSSDDRWSTDAHWMGGCLLLENLLWGSVLQTLAARPQDPDLAGPGWRDTWLRRLAETPLYAARWLRHDVRDAYWRRGSVSEAYEEIEVPVLAVGGWADAYADTVPGLLEGLGGRSVRGWVGPWAHVYPHNGVPGPAAGFLQIALAWWDRCLRGEGAEAGEPAYRIWMGEGGGRPWAETRARGRWVVEDGWPSPDIRAEEWPLSGAGPLRDDGAVPVPWTGAGAVAAGAWCPFGLEGLPRDQAPDDAVSVLFDFPPLPERIEILGAPAVELALSCDQPQGMVAVRICDVAPDGTSVRVTYGLLDLAFRDGMSARRPLEPGRMYRVRVPLRHCAWSFPPGHRIRIAVSTSYWPVAWPLPRPFQLGLIPRRSVLHMPVRSPRSEDDRLPELPPPEAAPSPAFAVEDPPPARRTVRRQPGTGRLVAEVRQGWDEEGEPALYPVEPIGLETGWGIEERFLVDPADPSSAEAHVRHVVTSSREGWSTRLEVRMRQLREAGGYRLRAEIRAHAGGVEVHRREIEEIIPPAGR